MGNISEEKNLYICINCGNTVSRLYSKYAKSVKCLKCEKCHNVADKYIEFEPVIILIDAILLSEKAVRHILYNRDFKFLWKLSTVLLLLESFALWRKKRFEQFEASQNEIVQEKGFYICCLENIIDYIVITFLLLLVSMPRRKLFFNTSTFSEFAVTLMKAVTVANFSKFFLLPLMVWRENTTLIGSSIHNLLVMSYYILCLISVFSVITRLNKLQSLVIVLPIYFAKKYLILWLSNFIE
ncbi:protein ARV1 [Teleopsis dalmanni]|uniref:protein ARV1 n=1 Tax=Teleopsis dalmanni TaxID=139649 RepID=UPI0018CFB45E|nr:protein ARV1 [Teleopsis dalmanni]